MRELIVASRNKGKILEIKELLAGLPLKVTSLLDHPHLPDVVEDGKTYKANALKKAITIAKITGKMTMSDDSGIEVKALNNAPGIYSARFAGEAKNEGQKNQKLFKMLKNVPMSRRQCRYRCVIALVDGKGKELGVLEGTCSGLVATKNRGTNGFGFDPLFIVVRYNKTFGELDPSIKAKISHRARALMKFRFLMVRHLK